MCIDTEWAVTEVHRLRAQKAALLEALNRMRCCNCRSMINDPFAMGCFECRPARAAIAAAEEEA